jgi:virginiamycin B lyase
VVRRRKPGSHVAAVVLIVAACSIAAIGPQATASEPTWFDLPSPDSFPQGIAAGPDGGMWVANQMAAEIVRVGPHGAVSTFALEFGVDPLAIVQGPDGAMWFTEQHGSRVGRLTPEGDLSEIFLRDMANPTGIAVGPDGALWLTERGVGSIARLTLDGELQEWSTVTPRAAPLGITAGPDGALWFTEPAANAIGRIATDGTMTEFALPTPPRNPQWITTGPDGALWFTERATNHIGRLTVGLGLTEYPVPSPSAGVNGIGVGPDGAVWFTESVADAVGRISMSGEIVEIPLGEGVTPTGITTGPDGQIWFSAPGVNRVGRLAPAVTVDVTPPVVTIVSPRDGSVFLDGEGMLADYFCADEPGGSGLVSCQGPVADGAVVPNSLGSHTFTVTATDGSGNEGAASRGYVVFDDIGGPITSQAVFAAGRTIPITLELGSRAPGGPVLAAGYPKVRAVDCSTGETVGPDTPTNVQASVLGNGRVMLQWRTGAGWGGSCRALVVRLAFPGWSDADAVFKLRFA